MAEIVVTDPTGGAVLMAVTGALEACAADVANEVQDLLAEGVAPLLIEVR